MSFEEFWPRYLREHSRPATRRVHVLGIGAAILVSIAFAMIHGFASITHRGNQIVSGVAINFIAAGSTVALVGATGAGKTTLVNLVPRLYDPTAGAVLVDGADVRTVDLGSLRREIALVSDDAFLFSATLYPITVYPEWVQGIVMAFPLWHGVDMIRQLTTGLIQPSIWVHLGYFAVMILLGVAMATKRLKALFLR